MIRIATQADVPRMLAIYAPYVESSTATFEYDVPCRREFMQRFLDITPGSVSVLGLMNDHDHRVQLLIDADVLKGEYFGCHPCINTASLRLKMADLLETILPALGCSPRIVTLE